MTKKYSEFFRKHGNPASVVPEMLAESQENGSTESRKRYYAKKLDEANGQAPITSQEDIGKAIESMPDDKVAVFFNVQHLDILRENDFMALDDYIEMVRKKTMKREFYRGFHHGPAIVCAFTKKQISEKTDVAKKLSGYPTVALYL